mmetsp:Transcript_25273/g.71459  ORF Transcript_25273/g.71459 Transcript_25273/m.71459 type:complete len:266 (+) Transcript_25273:1510-2307(+)
MKSGSKSSLEAAAPSARARRASIQASRSSDDPALRLTLRTTVRLPLVCLFLAGTASTTATVRPRAPTGRTAAPSRGMRSTSGSNLRPVPPAPASCPVGGRILLPLVWLGSRASTSPRRLTRTPRRTRSGSTPRRSRRSSWPSRALGMPSTTNMAVAGNSADAPLLFCSPLLCPLSVSVSVSLCLSLSVGLWLSQTLRVRACVSLLLRLVPVLRGLDSDGGALGRRGGHVRPLGSPRAAAGRGATAPGEAAARRAARRRGGRMFKS